MRSKLTFGGIVDEEFKKMKVATVSRVKYLHGIPWKAIAFPWRSIEYHAVCMRKSIEIQ